MVGAVPVVVRRGVPSYPPTTTVNLSEPAGAEHVSKALPSLTNLQHLNLECTSPAVALQFALGMACPGACAWVGAVPVVVRRVGPFHPPTTTDNYLWEAGAEHVSKALPSLTNLQHLNLSGTSPAVALRFALGMACGGQIGRAHV